MTPRQARLGVDLFAGVVIVTVALALASLTWRLTGYSGVGPAAAPVASGDQGVDIKPVLALAPFGSAASSPATGSDGPMRLRAIFLAIPIEASTVLLAGADGKVAQYGIGQSVGSGVIEAIQAEQVILRTPGGPRTFGFGPDAGAAPAQGPVWNAAAAGAGPADAGPPTGAAAIRALIPPDLQGGTATISTSTVAEPAISAPPPGARVSAPPGYVVGPSPGSAILAAGVRPGDVIQRVNGTPVTAGMNERDLVAQAAAAGTARLEILRNGQRVSLSVPVR